MTDNRTTELLREGLTERGIEWRSGLKGVTFVGDWCFVEYDNGKLAATCEPALTPEQAIAATLGAGECEMETDWDYLTDGIPDAPEDTWAYMCSLCNWSFRYDRGIKPNYCPKCGAKVTKII